ncbi:uncharacterized protein [Pyrus communis]|uniref:uncharacterized protein n=1 Tax=Pyrus communis TaxID=23211 RepID=UPI0035C03BE1
MASPTAPSTTSSSAALSSDSSSIRTTITPTLPTTFNISHMINTPMDCNNYLSWRSQFQDVLEIHGLEDTVVCNSQPSKRLDDSSVNPTYSQDKLVLSWIKATCSSSIKPILLSCTTAYAAWSLLEKRLSPLFKIHLRTIRDELRNLKKTPRATYDSSITDDELIESILDGLGREYKEFKTSVHLRPSLSFDDCYDLLLQEEHLIQKMSSLSLSNGAAFNAKRATGNFRDSQHGVVS